MINEEILRKAIAKAKGYKYGCIVFPEVFEDKRYYSLIFSHDFVKAFWGEETVCDSCGNRSCWEGELMCTDLPATLLIRREDEMETKIEGAKIKIEFILPRKDSPKKRVILKAFKELNKALEQK